MYIKKYLHLMEEFRVIQKQKDLVEIELVKGKEYTENQFQELIGSLKKLLGEGVDIVVTMVDKIDLKGRIKRKAIESWVN
jgi:wyosine [tRNA(Phe)-imidazoG37] synthetase (radical SAM superfamily)